MKQKITHCTHCGAELFDFLAEPENITVSFYGGGGDVSYMQLDTPYNGKGERNYATVWQCPNYERKPWYLFWQVNPHTIFVDYGGEKHYPSNL